MIRVAAIPTARVIGQNGRMGQPDRRKVEAAAWAARVTGLDAVRLEPVSGDASFRRYFRFYDGRRSLVLMDAPPDKEDSQPFVDIDGRLRAAGLHAPQIIHFDLARGFGVLEDFGDTLYRELIRPETADAVFPELFAVLEGLAGRVDASGLPVYGTDLLGAELDLFRAWYLERHRQRKMSRGEADTWERACRLLTESAMAQPQVFVHKDFHSCNLLQTAAGPGIIDFQDGVRGPVSYDFVSLVWDRYIAWPRDRIASWMEQVRNLLPGDCSPDEWVRRCDWMGLQRNLKIVGIFARLRHRDGKEGYVEMIPRFYRYLLDVLPLYPEFADFQHLLEDETCAP